MRTTLPERLEAARIRTGPFASDPSFGAYGYFRIRGPNGADLTIVASGGAPDDRQSQGWEHVSVSTGNRCPNWPEMSFVKDLFWAEDECVVEFHPPRSDYVNNHPYTLHLWRHRTIAFPMPPSILVGRKDLGVLDQKQAEALWIEQQRGSP